MRPAEADRPDNPDSEADRRPAATGVGRLLGRAARASSAPTDDAAVKPIRPPDQAVDRQAEGNEETSAVDANRRRAVIICATPALIAGVVVGLVLVAIGLLVIGAVAWVAVTVALSVWLWRFAPGAVARSVGASPSDESEHPRLHNLVDGLCATMGLPRPTICIVNSPVPNAMAVGRDPATASLLVTSGLDQSLTLVELEGVLAHELVHVKRQDTLVAGLAVMVTTPWSAGGRHHQSRRNGAFPGRPRPRILGRPTGRRGGPLSARHRLGTGGDGRSAAVGTGVAAGCRAHRPTHPLAVGRSDGGCPLRRVRRRQPRRHRSPGRRPVIALIL